LFGSVIVLPGSVVGASLQPVPLLDAGVFRKLFQSEVVTPPPAETHSGSEESSSSTDQGGAPGSTGDGEGGTPGSPLQQQGSPAEELAPTAALLSTDAPQGQFAGAAAVGPIAGRRESPLAGARHANGSDSASAAALGVAGLLAAQAPRARGGNAANGGARRRLLDRDAMAGLGTDRVNALTRSSLDAISRMWSGVSGERKVPVEPRDRDASIAAPAPDASGNSRHAQGARRSRIEW
jgi:hypothetical protein